MRYFVLFILFVIGIFWSCQRNYTPKPRGYFRIDMPKKSYHQSPDILPYVFEYPTYSVLVREKSNPDQKYWIDMVYPQFDAMVYFSYKKVDNNLDKYLTDARNFVYKHTIKADAIIETPFINPDKKVYGVHYDIKGDAASNVQFYLTDSTKNFVRGALYFNVPPNKDSLAPVINFINQDIVHLMETFEWN